jgi:hypothetical protein
MEATGADTSTIKDLVREVSFGKTVPRALATLTLPDAVKNFVQFTFDTIAGSKVHEIASLFTFGRENLIPDQFCQVVEDLEDQAPQQLDLLLCYLDRHMEGNGGEHRPMARQMIGDLCGEDETKWEECRVAAIRALEHRLALWDGISACIHQRRQESESRIYGSQIDVA